MIAVDRAAALAADRAAVLAVDWAAALAGGAIGLVMGALFFAGLAVGMRRALRSPSAVPLLTLSALVRMTALLGVGWGVLALLGAWAGGGYALAFLMTRLIATTVARAGAPTGEAA